MRTFAIASALLTLTAATTLAGDLAVSESTLQGMGLAGMQQLSDHDGLAVRGKGFISGFVSSILPQFSFELPGPPAPPSNQPGSPFDSSPFDNSFMNSFQIGSQHFGSGPSLGGNTFNFGGIGPWSQ